MITIDYADIDVEDEFIQNGCLDVTGGTMNVGSWSLHNTANLKMSGVLANVEKNFAAGGTVKISGGSLAVGNDLSLMGGSFAADGTNIVVGNDFTIMKNSNCEIIDGTLDIAGNLNVCDIDDKEINAMTRNINEDLLMAFDDVNDKGMVNVTNDTTNSDIGVENAGNGILTEIEKIVDQEIENIKISSNNPFKDLDNIVGTDTIDGIHKCPATESGTSPIDKSPTNSSGDSNRNKEKNDGRQQRNDDYNDRKDEDKDNDDDEKKDEEKNPSPNADLSRYDKFPH